MKVGLYIPCYNVDTALLHTVIEAVGLQVCQPSRVLLVDDGSDNELEGIHGVINDGIEIVRHEVNMGLSAARNTAFRTLADCDVVAQLDADVVPEPEWLEQLVGVLEREPGCMGVGGPMLEKYVDTPADKWRAKWCSQFSQYEIEIAQFLPGCNTVYRMEAWLAHHFDESYRANGEDVDFGTKIRESNMGYLKYWPWARCWHYRTDTVESVLRMSYNWMHARDGKTEYDDPAAELVNRVRRNADLSKDRFKRDWNEGRFDLLAIDRMLVGYWSAWDAEYLGVDDPVVCRALTHLSAVSLLAGSCDEMHENKAALEIAHTLHSIGSLRRDLSDGVQYSERVIANTGRHGTRDVLLVNLPGLGTAAGSRWSALPLVAPESRQLDVYPSRYVPFPFRLATAAALLRKHGVGAAVLDGFAENLNSLQTMERIRALDPKVVVFELGAIEDGEEPSPDVAMVLQECAETERRRVILVGPGVQGSQAGTFDVYRGEYEQQLVWSLADESVGDVGWRDAWPLRDGLPMFSYADAWTEKLPHPMLQAQATRGCPHRCVFCLWPHTYYKGKNKVERRDPRDVADEVLAETQKYGSRSFYFDDDAFNSDTQYVVDVCETLYDRFTTDVLPWGAMCGATKDNHIWEVMARAGCVGVKIGLECGDDEMRRRSGKSVTREEISASVKAAQSNGLHVHLTVMFGLPGETERSIQRTIRSVLIMEPDSVQFSRCRYLVGTPIAKKPPDKGQVQRWDTAVEEAYEAWARR